MNAAMPRIEKTTPFRVFTLEETQRHSSPKYGDVWSLTDQTFAEVKLIRLPPDTSHHSKDVACVTFLFLLKGSVDVKVSRRTVKLAPYEYLLANPRQVIRVHNLPGNGPAEFIWTRYPLDMSYQPVSRQPAPDHRR
jgi:glyoxylate utilization-related uncharacterized protein